MRLRGSRSDKTESDLLSGLSREASTKRRSGIGRNFNLLYVVGLFSGHPKAFVKRIRRIHLFNIYSRKAYQQRSGIIGHYQRACGKNGAVPVTDELKRKYDRRLAF